MTSKRVIITIAQIIVGITVAACSKVDYDHKALGFVDRNEMEAAFAKGYHTKQKLDEMMPKAKTVPSPKVDAPQADASVPVVASTSPNPTAVGNAAPTPPTSSQTSESIDINCGTVEACVNTMLLAAGAENIGQAMLTAKRIDAMPKPTRGDRKLARKSNAEGLESLRQKNLNEAIKLFEAAHEADPSDEEAIGNLAYSLSEAKQYQLAEKAAYDALLINPNRANFWSTIAVAKQATGKPSDALKAMWLVWQFAPKKQPLIEAFEKKIGTESDQNIRSLYVSAKSWLVEGQKPKF